MPALNVAGSGKVVSEDLFGGNILAHRDTLDEAVNYDELVEDLGVHTLRYPGGSVTETYFDFANPDLDLVADRDSGEERDFIPISEFMEFAEEEGLNAVLVLNTRDQLSDEMDENGDRFAAIDEVGLRQFVNDAVSGTWGDVNISGFEIGNEYWGSGRMSAAEYGRVASEMAKIIDDELKLMEADHPEAAESDVIVQMGTNFNYSSLGDEFSDLTPEETLELLNERYDLDLDRLPNWTEVNNEIIMSYFDTAEEFEALDAINAHVYSKGEEVAWQRSFMLDTIENTWMQDDRFSEKEIHVSEWNQSGVSSNFDDDDYGLKNGHELLNILEEFADHEVDAAQVWPLLQWTKNTMSQGFDYEGLTPTGTMFSMMAENLPGKSVLDLKGGGSMADNASFPDLDVHGFYGEGEAVFYFASNSSNAISQEVDVSGLFQDVGGLEAQVLGVAEGENPGDQSSIAVLRTLDPGEVFGDGFISAELDLYEIMQVKITDFTPTEAMQAAMDAIDSGEQDGSDVPDLPVTDPDPEDDDEDEPDEEEQDEEGFLAGLDGIAWVAALLPLLGLAMLGG
ncbi:hypothetical protein [Salipiger sp. PrR003]|uniref:hypothetical protein n=1 Tax=Salipiger sp. PrR003 TaxID=2706776 RepID=UPI0013DD09B4|nr:hypothetical protein [Salipiger sp. PrR003]NDV50534.1 hypothetical protein [Salipiger sp. PrR003]